MTTTDLILAVTVGNIVSMVIIGTVNYYIDRRQATKRRARIDEILSKIDVDIDLDKPLNAKASAKKVVKKAAPKKNG